MSILWWIWSELWWVQFKNLKTKSFHPAHFYLFDRIYFSKCISTNRKQFYLKILEFICIHWMNSSGWTNQQTCCSMCQRKVGTSFLDSHWSHCHIPQRQHLHIFNDLFIRCTEHSTQLHDKYRWCTATHHSTTTHWLHYKPVTRLLVWLKSTENRETAK